jgi:uncharacterized protein
MRTLHNLRTLILALIATLALAVPALAQTFPALTGRVVDNAKVLDPGVRAMLTTKLAALEAKTSDQVVVATVGSLQGFSVEVYATALFREWRLGRKDGNNGVLFLVAPTERKVRIEVGYGLEGALPDAAAKLIIEEKLAKWFRAGRFDTAIQEGVDAIVDVLTEDAGQWKRRPSSDPHVIALPAWANVLAVGVLGGLFLVFVVAMASILVGNLIRGLIAIHALPEGADRRGILGKLILFGPTGSSAGSSEHERASSPSPERFAGGGGSFGGGGASGSW